MKQPNPKNKISLEYLLSKHLLCTVSLQKNFFAQDGKIKITHLKLGVFAEMRWDSEEYLWSSFQSLNELSAKRNTLNKRAKFRCAQTLMKYCFSIYTFLAKMLFYIMGTP